MKNDTISRRGKRNGWWLLLVAAVVLEVTACIQYFYARHAIREEVERRAEGELKRAELEIDAFYATVETSVRFIASHAERSLDKPDAMGDVVGMMIENTDDVMGAYVAFEPNYFPEKGYWWEIYGSQKSKVESRKQEVETRQIGSAEHDYFQSEWYKKALVSEKCVWSEPYYDKDGSEQMVVSCSYPIRNKQGQVVGVAGTDVSLAFLQRLSEYLQVYPESYYSIQSASGISIVSAPETISGRKYQIFAEDIEATGWRMTIIIPDDVIYADLRHVGLIVIILMAVGLAILAFILYKSHRDTEQLIRTTAENERIEGEISVARGIQMAMLPKQFPPFDGCRDVNIFGTVIPAKEVGGDLYDFFVKDNNLYFCIGDVSGKGVPAAFVMGMIGSLFRAIAGKEQPLEQVCRQMNDSSAEGNEQNMFATLFVGRLNLQTGDLDYCNAGHNAPVKIERGKGKGERGKLKIERLPVVPNLPLGVVEDYPYQAQHTVLQHGDTLFLYTDGLTEAENKQHEQFGEERMTAVLQNAQSDSKTMVNDMLSAVHAFVGDAEQSDDLTMLAIQYTPSVEGWGALTLPCDIQQIPVLAQWIDGLDIPSALKMPINLALEEAVSNIMLYSRDADGSSAEPSDAATSRDADGSSAEKYVADYPSARIPSADEPSASQAANEIHIEAQRTEDTITFVITDSGRPFDPTAVAKPDITLSAEERAIGGLGIHLVKQIMDSVEYQRCDNKNILTLIKSL